MPEFVFNGGEPLKDCPVDWDAAKEWEMHANHGKDDLLWSFDCGFKLDFDGSLVRISSRFYPPKSHQGDKWDGTLTVTVGETDLKEIKFECDTLEALKVDVEKVSESIKAKLITLLQEL